MKKLCLFFAVIPLLYACKSKDTTIPNRPPNAFVVTPTLKSDGKTIVLNWTKAKDLDGDAVTYAVVLKDTLVKNISDTTFTISNLDFNYNQTGKIIAKDAKGLTTEASFSAMTKTIIYVNIPDAVFEKYLVDNKIDKDGLVNGKMDVADAKGVTFIGFDKVSTIKSLIGIEVFTDLQFLYCQYSQLTNLDLSKNIALQDLYCYDSRLITLDLSKNINLQNLYCGGNQLTTLDLSKSVNLKFLYCQNNKLTALDLSKNIILQQLACSSNSLSSLDISKNIALEQLFCNINRLAVLDVSKNLDLKLLDCRENQIKTICVADKVKADANTDWYRDAAAAYVICK